MLCKKVNLQWISNNAWNVQETLPGLDKKAGELVTLCGIKIYLVVYGDGQAYSQVWPSNAEAK
jgi:hypothetical protein